MRHFYFLMVGCVLGIIVHYSRKLHNNRQR